MTKPLKIALILGSTRDARFAPIPAEWMLEQAASRDDIDLELVDLKDFDLPLFNEKASNAWMPSGDPRAVAWQKRIGEFDGYIVVTAEYNHSITGALKNAFDQAYVEWAHKPIGFLAYGGVGGARAVEHARMIAVELQMVPVHAGVHIGGSDYVSVVHQRQPMSTIHDHIAPSAQTMLNEIVWWGNATRNAREADARATQ
ncbi:NADPH-dependent FMN reductase [Solilutibacter tolerans]|uniref:NAD(P)H-dependent FMN reductase n=1 Tax=Solilutibacter tolerans TaxID=1604334 RepID=A0A1N6QET0_9GAMM|nr:NAD(P)H-dependent oxidoreductase [Lysobacter tolerans]SIQ15129.1 NAD(P)H-dependent FMN reductase [Lysobacter tolerans]